MAQEQSQSPDDLNKTEETQEVEKKEGEQSPVEQEEVTTTTEEVAEESESGEDEQPKSALEAALKAIAPKDEGKAEVTSTEAKVDQGKKVEAKAETDDAQFRHKDDPPKTAKRIEKLLEARKTLREENTKLKGDFEKLTEDHKRLGQYEQKVGAVDEFLDNWRSAGMSAEQMGEALDLAVLVNTDPEKALERLIPVVKRLQSMTGDELPDDIREKVGNGQVDEDTARELARTRAQAKRNEQLAKTTAERSELTIREREQVEAKRIGSEMASAVSRLESEWKGSDPDYAAKQAFILDKVRAKQRAKPPTTVEDALKLVREAKTEVEANLSNLLKRKPELRPTPNGQTLKTRPEPKTALEAAAQAIGANA